MKISLIVPVYNMAPWLRECIDSLLAQDIPADEYEIIAVNDGSTDESPAILREYEAAHPGRFVIVDQPNTGLGPARNAGLARARGKYVWFVDSDDIVRKNSLAAVANAMETSGAETLITGYETFLSGEADAQRHGECNLFDAVPSSPTEALCFCKASVWNKISTREFLLRADMKYLPLTGPEDMAVTFRLLASARKIVKTDTVCYYYRWRPGSMLQTYNERRIRDVVIIFQTIESQIAMFPNLRDEYEYLYWKELEWVIRDAECVASASDAAMRAVIAAHLPTLKAMFAAADFPLNPYIRLVLEQRGNYAKLDASYKNSLSWKITAPLRFAADVFTKKRR